MQSGVALPRTTEEKYARGVELKTQGNAFLKSNELRKALKTYNSVFLYVNGLIDSSDQQMSQYAGESIISNDQGKRIEQLKRDVYLNIALCHLKQAQLYKTENDATQSHGDTSKPMDFAAKAAVDAGDESKPMDFAATAAMGSAGKAGDVSKPMDYAAKAAGSADLYSNGKMMNAAAKAAENASKALGIAPNNAKAHLRLGMARTYLKQWDKAKQSLLKANELEPNDRMVLGEIKKFKEQYEQWKGAADAKEKLAFSGKFM